MNVRLKNILNKVLWVFGANFRNMIITQYLHFKDRKGYEHIEHYGDLNEYITIYFIRPRYGKEDGLLSLFSYIMGRIDYADRNGLVPFVDVDAKTDVSTFNRYFHQKTQLTREEVYKSKNVLLSGYGCKSVFPGWCDYINTEHNEEKRALLDQYIEITDEVKQYWNLQKDIIHPENCLGLYLRGTDYIQLKPSGHPIQPTLSDVKEQIDEILNQENLKRIFLVTEDLQIKEEVERVYPGMVMTITDDLFFHNDGRLKYVGERIREAAVNVEENNIRYLVKILLLSECKALVGGRTNGSVVAAAFNGGKYSQKFIYDVGLY